MMELSTRLTFLLLPLLLLSHHSWTNVVEVEGGTSPRQNALKAWMGKYLIKMYTDWNLSSDSDSIFRGRRVYDRIKAREEFVKSRSTGLNWNIRIERIKGLTTKFKNEFLISDDEEKKQRDILGDENMFKVIRDHFFVRQNGDIMLGLSGFLKLSNKDNNATFLFAFRKFKFNFIPTITYIRLPTPCILWGVICKTQVEIKSESGEGVLTSEETVDLVNFMKFETLKDFGDDQGSQIRTISNFTTRFRPFLPDDVKAAIRKMEDNTDDRPDLLFVSDPLDGNKFDL